MWMLKLKVLYKGSQTKYCAVSCVHNLLLPSLRISYYGQFIRLTTRDSFDYELLHSTDGNTAKKRKLGPKHPETLASMSNLASLYFLQGKWNLAGQLWAAIIPRMKERLGREHPHSQMHRSVRYGIEEPRPV
uniref:Kinesin light chain n=1 Tax=Bionectria ochroleuca TaxID=29856 RepID=A0A0B7KS22_BIOOC